jgi:hypothetical protein
MWRSATDSQTTRKSEGHTAMEQHGTAHRIGDGF